MEFKNTIQKLILILFILGILPQYTYQQEEIEPYEKTILILGPTGQGKSTIANYIYNNFMGYLDTEDMKEIFVVKDKNVFEEKIVTKIFSVESAVKEEQQLNIIDSPGLDIKNSLLLIEQFEQLIDLLTKKKIEKIDEIIIVMSGKEIRLDYNNELIASFIEKILLNKNVFEKEEEQQEENNNVKQNEQQQQGEIEQQLEQQRKYIVNSNVNVFISYSQYFFVNDQQKEEQEQKLNKKKNKKKRNKLKEILKKKIDQKVYFSKFKADKLVKFGIDITENNFVFFEENMNSIEKYVENLFGKQFEYFDYQKQEDGEYKIITYDNIDLEIPVSGLKENIAVKKLAYLFNMIERGFENTFQQQYLYYNEKNINSLTQQLKKQIINKKNQLEQDMLNNIQLKSSKLRDLCQSQFNIIKVPQFNNLKGQKNEL